MALGLAETVGTHVQEKNRNELLKLLQRRKRLEAHVRENQAGLDFGATLNAIVQEICIIEAGLDRLTEHS